MDLLTWGRSPWGQQIVQHVSWDLFWASLFAGVVFLLAHASYMVLSAHRKRQAAETDAMEAARADLPPKIKRHSGMARLFHWVMAASMFTLLFTAFLQGIAADSVLNKSKRQVWSDAERVAAGAKP